MDEATKITEDAIRRADKLANDQWRQDTEDAIITVALAVGPAGFISDDVRPMVSDDVPHDAMGPCFRRLAKRGLIRMTGQFRKSTIPKKHKKVMPVWEII
jgi:hypothetical protein